MHATTRERQVRLALFCCVLMIPAVAPGDDKPKQEKGTPSGEVFGGEKRLRRESDIPWSIKNDFILL
jgi:hypothetical protein